jgi:hypothetical protein
MRRTGAIAAVAALLVLGATGCGGGTTTVLRTVTTPGHPPIRKLSLAHRDPEAPRVEPGHRPHSEAGCVEPGGGRVKTIYLRSEGETCVRVAPRDRLLFVDATGSGGGAEVSVGSYQAYIGIGGSALFPAPVGTYLGQGSHRARTGADATAPWVLVLPEGCQVKETRPGESLCFAAGAPPCPSSALALHAGRGGAGLGTYYGHTLLVNRSDRTCSVSGLPQVTPIDAAGREIRAPFETDGHTTTMSGNHPRTITLEPGAAATFEMNSGTAANYPRSSCHPRKAATLEVAIPGAGGPPLSLPSGLEVCASRVNVSVGRIE